MSNGPDDKAFDAMNSIIGENENIIPEGGEVSAWFPSGKFLGMDVPEGTSGIIEGLVFLAAGSPSTKVANAVTSQIRKHMASVPPQLEKDIVTKASNYLTRAENVSRKLAIAGERGRASGRKVFEHAVREAPPGLARDKALAKLTKESEAIAEYAKRFQGSFKPPVDVERMQTFKTSKFRDLLDEFSASRLELSRRDLRAASKFSPAWQALGKFSVPMLLDEFEK